LHRDSGTIPIAPRIAQPFLTAPANTVCQYQRYQLGTGQLVLSQMRGLMRKPPMRVIAVAATKGGVGKTTIASALAVRAAEDNKRVALLDLDPQESLASWWDRRKSENPKLFEVDATTEAIDLLTAEGWDFVFIDTPPAKIELVEGGIAVADLVLIPCRPSALDIEQADIAVELCEAHGKPYAFVLNHAAPAWKLTKSSIEFLKFGGRTVLEPPLTFRQAYMAAMTVGKSGPEVEKDGAARAEIDALWTAVKALASQKKVRAA
jgi:chromosome partitioning protein